ncbi:MAG TPA: hypothetical protein VIB39_16975 [Candidatus Angelobacter sp.]
MFRAYVNILALSLGLSNFAVLALAMVSGHALISRDFIVPGAVIVLISSLVFFLLKLVRLHDTRIAARALAQHSTQIANFKAAMRKQTAGQQEFSRGIKSWNS